MHTGSVGSLGAVLAAPRSTRRLATVELIGTRRLRPFFESLPGPEAARIADIVRYLSLWMVFKDPPEHTRLRRLTGKVFSAKAMQAMRPQAQELCAWLLDRRPTIQLRPVPRPP